MDERPLDFFMDELAANLANPRRMRRIDAVPAIQVTLGRDVIPALLVAAFLVEAQAPQPFLAATAPVLVPPAGIVQAQAVADESS
jgi:hypothetical protein